MVRASRWPLAVSGTAMVILWALVNLSALPVAVPALVRSAPGLVLPDLRFSYEPQDLVAVWSALGEGGRALYAGFLSTLDVAFPLSYTLFFALLTLFLTRKAVPKHRPWGWLALVPLAAGLADGTENAVLLTLLSQPAAVSEPLARLASLATGGKWVLAGLSLGLDLVLFLAWGFRARLSRRSGGFA